MLRLLYWMNPLPRLIRLQKQLFLMIFIGYVKRRHVSLFHTDYIVVRFVILFWYLVKEEWFKKEHMKNY